MLRRAGSFFGKAIAAFLSLIFLILIGAGVMLARGPVSLAPLAPYLEKFMDDPAWHYRVRFEDAVLSWEGWQKKLDLVVVGAKFVDKHGAELILVPRMSVVFSTQELLAGRFRVTGLELIEPKLRLLRRKNGLIVITNTTGFEEPTIGSGFVFDPALLNESASGTGARALGDLRILSVQAADLSFHDVASDFRFAVPAADLQLRRKSDGVDLRLSTRLRIGEVEAAIGVSAVYQNESTPVIAAVNFAEVHIAELAKAIDKPVFEIMKDQNVVAAGRVDFSILSNGYVDDLRFDVTTGSGQILVPGLKQHSLKINEMAAKGVFAKNFSKLTLKDLRLNLGDGLEIEAEGQWSRSQEGVALKTQIEFENLPHKKLSTYWPAEIAFKARNWVLENVKDGLISEGQISIDLRPGDLVHRKARPGMAEIKWKFRDVSSKLFREMPLLQNAQGFGHLHGQHLDLTIEKAMTSGLQISEGRLHIEDLASETPILDVEFVASGTVANTLALLDSKPLEFTSGMGINRREMQGTSATRAWLKIPLSENVQLNQVSYSAMATISGLSLTVSEGEYVLKDGVFDLSLEREAVSMSGQGIVNGVPLALSWKRLLQLSAGKPQDLFEIQGEVEVGQLQAFGFRPPRTTGRIGMTLFVELYPDGTRRGNGNFDLTNAIINWPNVAWNKPGAVAAALNLTFQSGRNGAVELDRITFGGGGLNFEGSARFDKKNNLVSLSGRNLTIGATRLAFKYGAQPNGIYKLDLAGPSLDLRSFVPRWLDGKPSKEEPELDLNIKIDLVYLTDEVALRNLWGVGRRQAGEWQSANMRAVMAGGQSVAFTVQGEAKGRRFMVMAGDAGGMARALGIYPDARGGTMLLNFLIPEEHESDSVIIGNLRADNFRVVKAKVLTRLLTLGSLTGLSDVLNDKGITFTRLTVPFTMRKGVLHMERARAVGPALAIIATGDYVRDGEALEFQGAIVPSYSINSVLGAIPILGELLIGRKGEGVFAFTYKVDGTLARPKVSVNLLSALAPGFLRRIVEGLEKPALGREFLKQRSTK